MAQDFKINSTTISRIVKGDWIDEPGDSQALDGVTPLARWRRLRLQADVLSVTEWNVLSAAEGSKVSVTAPNYSDRNAVDYTTYYGADFDNLSGSHDGPVMTGVTAEFLVRI